MRTTIDMPDALFNRAKMVCAQRNMTFKDLVVSAVDQALNETGGSRFVLRDASAGHGAAAGSGVSPQAINDAIDAVREGRSVP